MMYGNILVQALCNTGDVVLCTGAIALLKETYPQAKITVMVRSVGREIMENNPLVDEVIVAEYKSKQSSLKSMLALVKEIRKRKFDLSITLDGKQRSAVLVLLAGIPVRIGADHIFTRLSYWRKKMFTQVISPDCDITASHQSEIFQSIVRQITGSKERKPLVMARVEEKNERKVQELIRELPPHERRIALCVKGTFALKDWPPENFAGLIERLHAEYPGSAFYIVGAPGDRAYATTIISKVQSPVANFCGRTSLVDLKALLQQTQLFVTVDTGSVHIASTTDVPIVAIYGCTSPVRWHPLNGCYAVVSAGLPCTPCSVAPDDCPEHPCMRKIGIEKVMQSIRDLNWSH
jgi:lipopolysaccharide heptosyltransferase II